MIYLPNAGQAIIEVSKVRDYLLDPDHPQNRGKAGLYLRFGFTRGDWHVLAAALARHAIEHPVAAIDERSYGLVHQVIGSLASPDGRNPRIKSVWVIDVGAARPRLITAY